MHVRGHTHTSASIPKTVHAMYTYVYGCTKCERIYGPVTRGCGFQMCASRIINTHKHTCWGVCSCVWSKSGSHCPIVCVFVCERDIDAVIVVATICSCQMICMRLCLKLIANNYSNTQRPPESIKPHTNRARMAHQADRR